MYKNYSEYCQKTFSGLIKEASRVSKQLGYDIQIMSMTYFYNRDEWIIKRNDVLVENFPRSRDEVFKNDVVAFYYGLMDTKHKRIFDRFVDLIKDRVAFSHFGNVRSYKSDYCYRDIKGICSFALSCVYLQRLEFNTVDYLKGKRYFEKEHQRDFVKSIYYSCEIDEDEKVLEALKSMLYDNEGLIRFSGDIIRGMLLAKSEVAHDMVMDLLTSAGRSEGLRQAVVENIDFAEVEVYKKFLKVIHDKNLIRFSSVKRAFACYTGIEGMVDDKKYKILEGGIFECLVEGERDKYLDSESALDLYIGLYAMATVRLEDALEYINEAFFSVEDYKKAVMMLFVRKCNQKVHYKYIEAMIEHTDNDQILGIVLTRMGNQVIFDYDEEKREFIIKLSDRLTKMKKNIGSYGILDEETKQSVNINDAVSFMIGLSDEIHDCYEYAYKHLNRINYIRKIEDIKHPFVRKEVINLIESNTEQHRSFAFKKITEENIRLTPEEYEVLAGFMKSKRSDVRKYVTTLFQKAEPEVVISCAKTLVDNKNYQKRSGGLNILVENKERLKNHETFASLIADIDGVDFGDDFVEEVAILKGEQVQVKEVQAIYDKEYEPELKALSYDKKMIKKYLKPDEKGLIRFIKEVVKVYDHVVGREVEVKRYNGTVEIEKFGYGHFNAFRSNRRYRDKEETSYEDFFFYEELLPLDQLVKSEELEMFRFLIGLMRSNVVGSRYSVRNNKEIYEKLTARKYYPKIAGLKKYVKGINNGKTESYLISCIATLNMLELYKKSMGTYVEKDYSEFFLNTYCYMITLDEKNPDKTKGSGFAGNLKSYVLSDINFKERGEKVFQVVMHSDRINREKYLTFEYTYLFKFVELGYLKADYIYKEFFNFKEYGDYSKTTNSIRIINFINNRSRRKLASDLELEIYNKSISSMLEVELDRTEKDTLYSGSINAARSFYGVEVFLKSIYKMGKMPFLRGYSWVKGGKKNTFSHIIYYCEPLESDSQETFNRLVKSYKISDKKLLEAGMYNLKFIDFVTGYLGIKGMKKAAYYFKAHMKDHIGEEEQKMIRRYTDLDFGDLKRGQMDIKWFKESYEELGEANFNMLYDSAKYITSGGNHKRAQYFADAVLGRLAEEEVLGRIDDKRNQEMVLAYGLIPLGKDKNSNAVRRYKRLQRFIKESKQFGAQRKASELSKATIAIQNLARTYGLDDVNRFIWAMETEMVEEISGLFQPVEIEEIKVNLDVSKPESPAIVVEKNGRKLKSVPAKYGKHAYIKELKVAKKDLKEQYSRTKKSFENAMIDEVIFSFDELIKLKKHPIISHVIDKLLWTCGSVVGVLNEAMDGLITLSDEVSLSGGDELVLTHPVVLLEKGIWPEWQEFMLEHEIKQPFKQVFREVYVMTEEEKLNKGFTKRFAGYQVEPKQTYGLLKSRDWIVNDYDGFEKINHVHDLRIDLYSYADWYTPASIESPTIERVVFVDNKTGMTKDMNELSHVIFSEAMRDIDLVVSVAYVGGVDVMMNHSTIEMRRRILEHNLGLFKVKNYVMEKHHIVVKGSYGNYSVHLGSGIIHMEGRGMLPVFPVHSQHRGHVFLPFVDEDPKTAEIISKVLMLAKDEKIKDPGVLVHLRGRL